MHIPPPFLGKRKANFLIHLSHFFSVSTAQYAHYVFNAIDRDSNGSVSFEVIFLSNLFLRYHLCLWQWCHFASPPPFASSLIIMHVPYMPPTFLWTHRAFPSIKEKIKEEKSDKMKTVSFCCFHWAEKEEPNRLELEKKRELASLSSFSPLLHWLQLQTPLTFLKQWTTLTFADSAAEERWRRRKLNTFYTHSSAE